LQAAERAKYKFLHELHSDAVRPEDRPLITYEKSLCHFGIGSFFLSELFCMSENWQAISLNEVLVK